MAIFGETARKTVIHCWYCGKQNVTVTNCDCPRATQNRTNNSKVSELTTTHTGNEPENVAEMSEIFIDTIYHPRSDGRPHVWVKVQGTGLLNVILDSGAQATVIGRNHFQAIKEFQTLPMRACFTTISTADRTKHFPIGEVDAEYTIKDKTRIVTTIVANIDIARPLFGINFQR